MIDNTMNPLVSIILPVYNVQQYIEKCMDSILNQSYPTFEIIVVNDGSEDSSIELLNKYNDNRIQIYNKENEGLSEARNYGLEKSNGTYIYFMDSDDWIEPLLLEKCLKKIAKYSSDCLIFGFSIDVENENGEIIKKNIVNAVETIYKKEEKDFECTRNQLNLLGYAWNKIYKKSFLIAHKARFESGVSLVEDILFNAEFFSKSDRIVFIQECLYHYVNRPTISLMNTFHRNAFELMQKRSFAVETFLMKWEFDKKNISRIVSNDFIYGVRYCIDNLLHSKNDLTTQDKLKYIRTIVNNRNTVSKIAQVKSASIKDWIYIKMIQYKLVSLIYFLKKNKALRL